MSNQDYTLKVTHTKKTLFIENSIHKVKDQILQNKKSFTSRKKKRNYYLTSKQSLSEFIRKKFNQLKLKEGLTLHVQFIHFIYSKNLFFELMTIY